MGEYDDMFTPSIYSRFDNLFRVEAMNEKLQAKLAQFDTTIDTLTAKLKIAEDWLRRIEAGDCGCRQWCGCSRNIASDALAAMGKVGM